MIIEDVNLFHVSRMHLSTSPYLDQLLGNNKATIVGEALQTYFVEEDHRKFGQQVKRHSVRSRL